jgi:hypothetical protein
MQHKLLMTNIDSLKQHISLSTLNKTFREAIHVVRRLGIDYIWIDCLCIIQDSADDWSYESELMQHIYGNSNLNIAATASSDSRGGCFRSRNPQIITPIKLDYGEAHGQFYLTDVSLWWERFEKAPLNRRAWVLQERLLSPRVLHFDSDQLVWECNELTACERFPVGIGDLVPPRLRLRARFEAVFRSAVETGLKGRDMVEIWKPIVRAYSACKLTKSSDRLIALHGVAMKIKNVLGCQYSAGLFHRDMESQLLWEIEDTKTSSRPESHIAPSWSWASILGPVSVLPQWDQCTSEDSVRQLKSEELNEMALCKVLNKTTLETQVATPSASYEVLQIRGCLCPMFFVTELEARAWGGARRRFEANRTEGSIRGFPMSEPQPDDDGDIWPLMVTRKGWSCDTGNSFTYSRFQGHPKSRVVVSSIRGNQEASFEVQLHYDVMMEHRTKEERWLMPVYGVTEFEPVDIFDMNKHRSVNGIVLEMNGKVRGSFRRCGIFKISSASGFHDQWAFWKGCQRFDVEDVKIARFDGVLIPEEDPEQGPTSNWRKNRILYRERNQ